MKDASRPKEPATAGEPSWFTAHWDMKSPVAKVSGIVVRGLPLARRAAFRPANAPVTMASVCPTHTPALSPPTNRFSAPWTFIVLSLGDTAVSLMELPRLPPRGSAKRAFSKPGNVRSWSMGK